MEQSDWFVCELNFNKKISRKQTLKSNIKQQYNINNHMEHEKHPIQ